LNDKCKFFSRGKKFLKKIKNSCNIIEVVASY